MPTRVAFLIATVVTSTVAQVSSQTSAPTLLVGTVTGATVTLNWTPPAGTVVGYRLEAGTAPGLSNAANISIGPSPTFTTTGVPAGTYYVRVRAIGATGESAPSNEATVVVSGLPGSCVLPPNAPSALTASVAGSLIHFAWSASSSGCAPSTYVLHAGSSPGTSNIAVANLGNVLQFQATAPSGTYYVFVVAQNPHGQSPPSNIVTVTVGSPGTPPLPPSPTGGVIAPGLWRVNVNISPGRYFTNPASGCYWERLRGFSGSISDVIANEFIGRDALQWIVDILPSDAGFSTDSDCGTWRQTPVYPGPVTVAGTGVWLVGAQLPPGTYSAIASSGCYWARLRDFTGNLSGIIDNDFVTTNSGQIIVSISPGDVGFEVGNCFPFQRISTDWHLGSPDRRSQIELNWRAKRARVEP